MQERVRAIRQVPSIAFNILEGVMDIKKRGLFHYFLADPLDPELTSPSPLGLYQIDTDNRRQSISVSRCIDILAYCSESAPSLRTIQQRQRPLFEEVRTDTLLRYIASTVGCPRLSAIYSYVAHC